VITAHPSESKRRLCPLFSTGFARCYASYYNRSRTHLSLNKDAPMRRPAGE